MQSSNHCKACALGTRGEARIVIHCGTGTEPCPRPGCSGVCWKIWMSQEHLLNTGTFDPERHEHLVSKAVESLTAFKRAFQCPIHAISGLGNVLSRQGIFSSLQARNKPKELSERLTMELARWGAKEEVEWEKEQSRPRSHEYLVAVVPTPWWKWNARSAQKCCESCLWHKCLDAFEWWSPTWRNHFLSGQKRMSKSNTVGRN